MSLVPLSVLSKKQPPTLGPLCRKCGLLDQCHSPKMKPSGKGLKKILIVSDYPGKTEDQQGLPFVGESGELLRKLLLKCGVTMREDCTLMNALSCYPGWELDDPKRVEWCRPLVLDAIRKYDPNVIIPLGKYAVKSVIGHMYKEDTKGVMRWAGFQIPNRKPNVWICPSVNPAFVVRERDRRTGTYKDKGLKERWLLKHLKAAVELSGKKPWDEIPDYLSKVHVVTDLVAVKSILDRMAIGDRPVAFDYETDRLKPDDRMAKIICASVSDGQTTIGFPWLGEAIDGMKTLLESGVPKIAHNLRFEFRWTLAKLGIRVRNFAWDSMVQAHVIDGRPGIAGLKFQAYCLLGQEDYDSFLKEYLSSKDRGGNAPNRAKELNRNDLMKYCAIDSYLTWLIAQKQMDTLGIEL